MTFLPEGTQLEAQSGDTLLDVALDNGLEMPHECGGNCACTTCHIYVLEGFENLSPMEEVEVDRLSSAEGKQANSRLGCQAILRSGDVVVELVEGAAW